MNRNKKELLMYCVLAFVTGYLVCMYFPVHVLEGLSNRSNSFHSDFRYTGAATSAEDIDQMFAGVPPLTPEEEEQHTGLMAEMLLRGIRLPSR